jgi:hypothetical protein
MQKIGEVKMLEKETDKIASDIKVGSDNEITVKPPFVHNEFHLGGIEKAIALFFPSVRKEFLLRMRAETIDKVSCEAYKMAMNGNIPIKPIPNKIAVPLIEKMSLEHEPDMYEKWARLLIAAGVNPNPIHQQFADILANLNNQNANFLKEIYTKQADDEYENKFDEYIDKTRFQDLYKEAEKKAKKENDGVSEYSRSILSYMPFHNSFHFPLFISGTEEKIISTKIWTVNENSPMAIPGEREDTFLVLTKEENNMLLGLEKLGLIKYQEFDTEREKIKGEEYIYVKQYGVLLTKFGHSFVDCLEHPTK